MISKIFVPVRPVPASRPRIGRFGAYYTTNYTEFREQVAKFLNKLKDKFPANDDLYLVDIEFVCQKPKSPTNVYPRGDIDNFMKGILDSITHAKMFWNDDIQIVYCGGIKRYQNTTEEPVGIHLTINIIKKENYTSTHFNILMCKTKLEEFADDSE